MRRLSIQVRPARLSDVPVIHGLISGFARQQLMLERSTNELCERVRDFLVIEDKTGSVQGCAAVRIYSESMAELRSLAIVASMQGQGLGRQLVEGCVSETKALGLQHLFCLTYQTDFFTRLGFTSVERSRFPEKVWSDCVTCPSFLDCHEVAMWLAVTDLTALNAYVANTNALASSMTNQPYTLAANHRPQLPVIRPGILP